MSNEYPKVYLYRRIVQAKLYIDSNYAEALDLDDIADEAYFSRFHFLRLFKQAYGKTPHQYLVHVRVAKAKDLLKAGIPVTDACYAVGFTSVGSFSALFKKLAGLTPSAYRGGQLRIKQEVKAVPLKYVPGCYAGAQGWAK